MPSNEQGCVLRQDNPKTAEYTHKQENAAPRPFNPQITPPNNPLPKEITQNRLNALLKLRAEKGEKGEREEKEKLRKDTKLAIHEKPFFLRTCGEFEMTCIDIQWFWD